LATPSKSPGILNYSKILGKADLSDLWSDRLIATLIAIAPGLHFGQEVPQTYTQRLYYDLGDMHTLTPHIKEDIEFEMGPIVKLNPGKVSQVWNRVV
jgi:hypothetical protein